MAIGLTRDELRKTCIKAYTDAHKQYERGMDLQKETAEFLAQGMPQLDARVHATLLLRHEATIEAFIATIEANNARIESQLKGQ